MTKNTAASLVIRGDRKGTQSYCRMSLREPFSFVMEVRQRQQRVCCQARPLKNHRQGRVRLVIGLWCVVMVLARLGLCEATIARSSSRHSWETPGCHLVGHTRVVKIPDCVPFQVTTNACRGFCVSYAIPSPPHTLHYNPLHVITSRAKCCGITDTHDIPVQVQCFDGVKEMVFKSAKRCACSICRRE